MGVEDTINKINMTSATKWEKLPLIKTNPKDGKVTRPLEDAAEETSKDGNYDAAEDTINEISNAGNW